MVKINCESKKFWAQIDFMSEIFFKKDCVWKQISKKVLGAKKILCLKNKIEKRFGSGKKIGVWENFGLKSILGLEFFLCPIKLWVQKCWALKKFWVWKKFIVRKKFGSKEVWSKSILAHKNYEPQKLGPKSFVKIRSVIAEILLIYTNGARTYVVCTSVIMTVGIC